MKKILFVLLDGLGDGMRKGTTLQVATKPNLDFFGKNGFCGLVENNLADHPDSGSIFTLLGYPRSDYPGRGYLDALGAGVKSMTDTLYMRGNWGTVEEQIKEETEAQFKPKLIIKDRRAGRDFTGLKELSEKIKEIGVDGMKVKFYKSLGHRCVISISSHGIKSDVSDSDNEVGQPVQEIKALIPSAQQAATTLNKWSSEVHFILRDDLINKQRELPANYVLLRGASSYRTEKPFEEKFGMKGCMVGASPIVLGIGKHLEMDIVQIGTGNLKTDLNAKVLKALDELRTHDFVFLHVLGTDVAAHDGGVELKKNFLSKVDREMFGKIKEYLDFNKTILVVTGDHITSAFTRHHEAGPFPFLIYTSGINSNGLEFHEMSCKQGPMIRIKNFMEELLKFL